MDPCLLVNGDSFVRCKLDLIRASFNPGSSFLAIIAGALSQRNTKHIPLRFSFLLEFIGDWEGATGLNLPGYLSSPHSPPHFT